MKKETNSIKKNSKTTDAHSKDDSSQVNGEKNASFAQDLKPLMFGFGDIEEPDNETAELLEEYIVEYVQNIAILAFRKSKRRGFSEIKLRDLLLVLKNDKKKYYRIPPLLSFYETLKKAKK